MRCKIANIETLILDSVDVEIPFYRYELGNRLSTTGGSVSLDVSSESGSVYRDSQINEGFYNVGRGWK